MDKSDDLTLEKGPSQTEGSFPLSVDRDENASSRVRRKLDLNMMPLFFVMYMLAFLDRGNIGNAVGMSKSLHLTSSQYAWLSTIFYITYIVFEFCIIFWKLFPPHLVGTVVVFGWYVLQQLPPEEDRDRKEREANPMRTGVSWVLCSPLPSVGVV